jgi:signal transduction histidine kinase
VSPRRSKDLSLGLASAGRLASLVVIAVGALVLAGWVLDVSALVRIRAGLPAMNPFTAACFVLAGLGAWLLAEGPEARHAPHGRALALATAAIGGLRLLGTTPLSRRLEVVLFAAWSGRQEWGPMATGTATAMVLIGVGLAIMDSPRRRAGTGGQVLLLAAMAPALLSLGLYLFGAPVESRLPFLEPMAVHTAPTLVALVCASLLIRPRRGVMAVTTGNTIGSAMFRLMLPVVITVPAALGGLQLIGESRRLFGLAQGTALVATVTTAILVTGLWFAARGLSRAEEERRRMELALAESQQRLDMVLHSVGVGVWDWDIVSDTVTFDDTVMEHWHVERGPGMRMREVVSHIHPEDRERAIGLVRRTLKEGGEYSTSYRVVRSDGTHRALGARGYVTRDAEGRPVRLTGINWDVTRQQEAEEARHHAQLHQLELKDQFISHVSHELRSPLTVVYSFLEILLDGLAGEINEQQREFLLISQRNANQLRQMIEDLLEVTRAQTGKLVVNACRMPIAREIEATLEGLRPQAEAKQISLEDEFPERLPAVLADPYRVRQVLGNLVDNAVKFTPERGSIRLTASRTTGPEQALLVSVRDTGPGIPDAERDDIFRQLYQLDCGAPATRKGLGLGLYICRELVTRMGGRIWVESTPGAGSCFSFTLPLYSPAAAIVPLLTPENVARHEFRLIRVMFQPSTARSWADKDHVVVAAAAEVVRSCTLPDLDLILPRLGPSGDQESLCVLTCAGAEHAEALGRRIEGQLGRSDALQSSRLAWMIGMLALQPEPAFGADTEGLAAALAASIDTALDEADPGRKAA